MCRQVLPRKLGEPDKGIHNRSRDGVPSGVRPFTSFSAAFSESEVLLRRMGGRGWGSVVCSLISLGISITMRA